MYFPEALREKRTIHNMSYYIRNLGTTGLQKYAAQVMNHITSKTTPPIREPNGHSILKAQPAGPDPQPSNLEPRHSDRTRVTEEVT